MQPRPPPPNNKNKTQIIKLLSFKRTALTADFIPAKRFNFAHSNFNGKFLLRYNTVIIYTGCYQCSHPEQLKQNTKQKTAKNKRKAFTVEFIPVKRFNFAHSNFPGKFLLSYNTVIIYTGCYQCSPPEQLKQNTNQKTPPDSKEQLLLLSLFQEKDSTLLIPNFLENSFSIITQ